MNVFDWGDSKVVKTHVWTPLALIELSDFGWYDFSSVITYRIVDISPLKNKGKDF